MTIHHLLDDLIWRLSRRDAEAEWDRWQAAGKPMLEEPNAPSIWDDKGTGILGTARSADPEAHFKAWPECRAVLAEKDAKIAELTHAAEVQEAEGRNAQKRIRDLENELKARFGMNYRETFSEKDILGVEECEAGEARIGIRYPHSYEIIRRPIKPSVSADRVKKLEEQLKGQERTVQILSDDIAPLSAYLNGPGKDLCPPGSLGRGVPAVAVEIIKGLAEKLKSAEGDAAAHHCSACCVSCASEDHKEIRNEALHEALIELAKEGHTYDAVAARIRNKKT